jgi:DNA-binding XRE family transcriptional regulator
MELTQSECCGRRLAAIRIDRSLSQAVLAAAVGVSRQTIYFWESRASFAIRRPRARRLAHALGCQVKDLLAPLDDSIPPRPSNWAHIRQVLQRRQAPLRLADAQRHGDARVVRPLDCDR